MGKNTMPYPEPKSTRTGCKVSWLYYETREEAEKCAEAARHNGHYYASLGYDFGYCAPGSITQMPAIHEPGKAWMGEERAGLFEVCIP